MTIHINIESETMQYLIAQVNAVEDDNEFSTMLAIERITECRIAQIDPLDYCYKSIVVNLSDGTALQFNGWVELSKQGKDKRNDPALQRRYN